MERKTCSKCGIEKDSYKFMISNQKYHLSKCKDCYNAEKRNRYKIDVEYRKKLNKLNKESYYRNIKKRREYDRKRSDVKYNRNYRKKIKKECFKHYSNGEIECAICKFDNIDALTLDHVNGGGRKMAREIGLGSGIGGYRLYLYLRKNGFPKGFRVLCLNHQMLEALKLGFFNTSGMNKKSNRK